MEIVEFNRLVEDVVSRFLPRIPEKYTGAFEGVFAGGEHWMALEDIVHILADYRIATTPEERETLRLLVLDLGDEKLIQELDRLTVAENGADG